MSNRKINFFKQVIQSPVDLILGVKNLFFYFTKRPLKLKHIVFMVTDTCNSRCSHCNIWRQKPTKNPLTPKEIEKIFSDKSFKNVKYILCTGGEPTVRDDLEEIFLSFHRVLPRATLQLSTNAILPERTLKIVHTMMRYNINFEVGISLDGIGEAHDKIRGVEGNFKRADWLIKELTKIRDEHKDIFNISVGIVASDLTIDSIYGVREYSKKLNIDCVEAWYNISSFYSNYNEKNKVELEKKITEIVKSQPISLLRQKWLRYLKGKSIKFPCFALNSFCVVKCDGDIVPCLSLWDAKAGNLREHSLGEIWHSQDAKKVREKIKNCQGCLNTWGFWWSAQSSYYQKLFFYLQHPLIFIRKLFL